MWCSELTFKQFANVELVFSLFGPELFGSGVVVPVETLDNGMNILKMFKC